MFPAALRGNVVAAQKAWLGAWGQRSCWVSRLSAGSERGSSTSSDTHTPKLRPLPDCPRTSLLAPGLLRAQCLSSCPAGPTGPLAPGRSGFLPHHSFHSSATRLKRRPTPEAPPRELDLLRYDMKHLDRSPRPAIFLGLAGLVPFLVPPIIMATTETYLPELAYAQLAYGASILSFLGGARWGYALPASSPAKPDWINLTNSVVPSLLAWTAMLLGDNITPAASMVIMGLGISLHYDLSLLPTYPAWFKALRAVLTMVALLSLFGTLVLVHTYPEKKIFMD